MTSHNKNIHPFAVGKFQCFAINDGVSTYATAAFMFDSAPQAGLAEALKMSGEDADSIACANTCLLIDTGTHRILIDTGGGRLCQWGPPAADLGQLPQHLATLNVPLESIDSIVFTHLHRDHAMGSLQIHEDVPLFTEARHVVHRVEWESLESDRKDPLLPLLPLIDLVDAPYKICPGISLVPSPGHSRGHCSIEIQSQGQKLMCLGDVIAHPFHLKNPTWTMGNEPDQPSAIETRLHSLDDAAAGKYLVHAYHMPFPSVGTIIRDDRGFMLEPVTSKA